MLTVRNNNDRPIYNLWFVTHSKIESPVIQSTLPIELIKITCRDILDSIEGKPLSTKLQFTILRKIKKRLDSCSLKKYFYLPNILFDQSQLNYNKLERYNEMINSPPELDDHVYSEFHNPLLFAALKFHFHRAQFLSLQEFGNEVQQISRKNFRLAVCDQRAASTYVLNYCQHNLFYYALEDEKNIYMMTTGMQLQMVLIIPTTTSNNN